jgi:hypothetical protein
MLLHLFEFFSSCISSLFLFEIPFSNNQMVSTRSGEGQDIPPIVRAHIANQENQAPPPPLNLAMDPAMQQFLAAQMQQIQKSDCHYSKHSSSAKSATTSSTTSTSGQA